MENRNRRHGKKEQKAWKEGWKTISKTAKRDNVIKNQHKIFAR